MKVEKMKNSMNLLLLCFLLLVGVMLDLAPIRVSDGVDKVYHFLGFSLITFFAILSFVSFFGKKKLNSFFMFLLISGGVFAGISEFLQSFTTVRDCSVADWLSNLLGITIITLIMFLNYSKESKEVESDGRRFEFKDLPVL